MTTQPFPRKSSVEHFQKKSNHNRKIVLLKDIVIAAGTVFTKAPVMTQRDENHIDCLIGLSKNTCGTLTYSLDENEMEELKDWFAELKQ